jgi:hypothetical protein
MIDLMIELINYCTILIAILRTYLIGVQKSYSPAILWTKLRLVFFAPYRALIVEGVDTG